MFMPLVGYLQMNRVILRSSSKVVGTSILSKTKGRKWTSGHASSKCFVDNRTMAFEVVAAKQAKITHPSVRRS